MSHLVAVLAAVSGMDEGTDNRPGLGTLERSMAVGYGVIGAFLVFGTVGFFLDRWFHTAPWLMVIGLICGVTIPLFGLRRYSKG